jgi:Holliday junction DNA helicase RuvA
VIAQLTGRVDALEADRLVIDVNGVGYLVQASSRTLSAVGMPPAQARLLVETQVREEAITLFGFVDADERAWFRLLTTVQGVGGKVALAILSALSPGEIAAAISAGDKASLSRASGVGARLAQRIATELRDKAGTLPTGGIVLPMMTGDMGPGAEGAALSALGNLGFKPAEARAAVTRAVSALGENASEAALISAALRELQR